MPISSHVRSNRARFLLSAGAVALALAAMIVAEAIVAGIYQLLSAYLVHAPGTLVVTSRETSSFLLGPQSTLASDVYKGARHVDGTTAVAPVLAMYTTLKVQGEKKAIHLVGYEPELGGGPWRLAAGREPATDKEVVVDAALAGEAGITLGSTLQVAGEDLRVCGLSQETALGLQQFLFVRKRAAERLLDRPGQATYLFVSVRPDANLRAVKASLDNLPGATTFVKADLNANDVAVFSRLLILPFRAVSFIAFALGSLVIALIGYGSALERRREYAIVKALGAANPTLYRVVLREAAATTLAGIVLGVALGAVAVLMVTVVAPADPIALVPGEFTRPVLAAVAMAPLGALIPARLVAGVAPASAFRS